MHIEINPCKAVIKKLSQRGCDINTINNDCYNIANSYGRVFGEHVKEKCNQKCAELINEKKKEMGKNSCSLRRPSPPQIWNQVPSYFPEIFKDSGDVKSSLEQCKDMCRNSRYPNSCLERCQMDSDAITLIKPPKKKDVKKEYYDNSKDDSSNDDDDDDNDNDDNDVDFDDNYRKDNPWSFFIGYFITSVIIIVIILLFVIFLYRSPSSS
jgi:hypothetical protein